MKVLKFIAALIVGVLLFAAECVTMGTFCVDKALTEDATEKAITNSSIVQELIDTALTENTVNGGGEYGEIVSTVMKTEAMTSFFTGYMTNAMRSVVYGETYEEIADDELMAAFSAGVDELNVKGALNITPVEEELIKQQMQRQMPDLTADLNQIAEELKVEPGDYDENIQSYRGFVNHGSQAVGIIICLLLCAVLFALFWRSKLGIVWCGIITLLTSVMLLLVYGGAGEMIDDTSAGAGKFVMYLAQDGIKTVAIGGFAAAVVFFVLYIILKKICGEKGTLH